MVTAGGLIFIGATMDNYLRAFDVENGDELESAFTRRAAGDADDYRLRPDTRQMVVIAAGGTSARGLNR